MPSETNQKCSVNMQSKVRGQFAPEIWGQFVRFFQNPAKPDLNINWQSLAIGENKITVGLFHLEGKSFLEKLKEGFNSSIEEGKIPFLNFFGK